MSTFYCSSCNKPIKTNLHRCGFTDLINCKIYDPGETTGTPECRDSLGSRSQDNLFQSRSGCPIGEDGLPSIPGENGYYSKGVSI